MKVIKCKYCGNELEFIVDSNVVPVCCGHPMQELVANTVDASQEKHVPEVKIEKNVVEVFVGSVEHPMTPEHHIAYIVLETNKGTYKKKLDVSGKPYAKFSLLDDEEVITVYEYCNLHGLWKKTSK